MANDPYYNSREMDTDTTDAETIYNEMLGHMVTAHGRILSESVSVAPPNPSLFDNYLIPDNVSGPSWTGMAGQLVVWLNVWRFVVPKPGMRLMVIDTGNEIVAGPDSVFRSIAGVQTLTPVFDSVWEVSWNASKGRFAEVTLAQPNTILVAPTNMRPGYEYVLTIKQSGGGGNDMDYEGGAWASPGQVQMALTTGTGNAVDIYKFNGPTGILAVPSETSRQLDITVI